MFQIKICGITSQGDAQVAADAGADAIGLNFFDASPRCVSATTAEEIVDSIRGRLSMVGVFVNHSADQIRAIAESLRLDYVQLHGDEPIAILRELAGLRVIRAFRCQRDGLTPAIEFVERTKTLGLDVSAVLIDAYSSGQYGGTGNTADWRAIRKARERIGDVPLVLAGGLHSGNVAEAISVVRPSAVDTASGVESSAGIKSRKLVEEFVAAAKSAF